MADTFVEIGLFLAALAATLAALFALGFTVMAVISYADCSGFQKGTGIETQWHWDCYAKVDGKWIPKEYVFGKVNELRVKEK